jgi:hypothetical protein
MHLAPATLAAFAFIAIVQPLNAGEPWVLKPHVLDEGKSCSLSRIDRGRTFSVILGVIPSVPNEGVVSIAFSEPDLVEAAIADAAATLDFDNGKHESSSIYKESGLLFVPIITRNLQDVLQNFWESKKLTIRTDHGSASFDLDGFGDRIPDLRGCVAS